MDFAQRRKHLVNLSEEELEQRFWQLANEIVNPLVTMASKHTSPSIERSVLLRMGFNSIEAGKIVKEVDSHGLLGKGAGHVVYRYSQQQGIDLLAAGRALAELSDWEPIKTMMEMGGAPDGC